MLLYIQEFSSNLSDAASTWSLQNIYKKGEGGSRIMSFGIDSFQPQRKTCSCKC